MQVLSRSELDALIARVAAGEQTALRLLFDATAPKLFGICLHLHDQRATAEDALTEVYSTIWEEADGYPTSRMDPMVWLISLTRRVCVRHMSADHEDPVPVTWGTAAAEGSALAVCIEELLPQRADAIGRAYFRGESYDDLSEEVGVPLNAIRTWFRRSLEKLRVCLDDE